MKFIFLHQVKGGQVIERLFNLKHVVSIVPLPNNEGSKLLLSDKSNVNVQEMMNDIFQRMQINMER